MATSKLVRARRVPRWTLVPVILSVFAHFVAGGTLPQFWSVDAGYEKLKTEIDKRYTQMKIIKPLKPMEMTNSSAGIAEATPIEETTVNIDSDIEDILPEKIEVPLPGDETFTAEKPVAVQPQRKMWRQENYEVIRRPAPKSEAGSISQDTIGIGSPYSAIDVFARDVVERVAIPIGKLASDSLADTGQGDGPNVLDAASLDSGDVPELDLSTLDTSDITTTASTGGVIQKDDPEITGFAINMVSENPSIQQTIAEGVSITDIQEPESEDEKPVENVTPDKPVDPDKGDTPESPAPEDKTTPETKVTAVPRLDLSFTKERLEDIKTAKPLEPHVTTDFTVYREEGSPNSFFKLQIRAKDGADLPVIRKNVLFVVDISLSIPKEELEGVRKAVRTYLSKHMHPEDKFNVVRFSEEARRAFYSFVPPNPKNIERGLDFIKKVPGQVKTDVYRVLHSIILNIFSRYRPCHVFLITDGHSTQGVRETRRIVRDIAPVTRSNISIFTVDIGDKGNRYLLDLVAYRSRGELVAIDRVEDIEGSIVKTAVRKDTPLLMNLSVNYANLKVDEVYPQILPNLYAGEGVVIYGQCEPGRKAAIQIYGQSAGGKWKRFLYPMVVPEGSNGDVAIAKEWARGKIHYLVAKIANQTREDDALVAEVIALGKKYHLPVPFTE